MKTESELAQQDLSFEGDESLTISIDLIVEDAQVTLSKFKGTQPTGSLTDAESAPQSFAKELRRAAHVLSAAISLLSKSLPVAARGDESARTGSKAEECTSRNDPETSSPRAQSGQEGIAGAPESTIFSAVESEIIPDEVDTVDTSSSDDGNRNTACAATEGAANEDSGHGEAVASEANGQIAEEQVISEAEEHTYSGPKTDDVDRSAAAIDLTAEAQIAAKKPKLVDPVELNSMELTGSRSRRLNELKADTQARAAVAAATKGPALKAAGEGEAAAALADYLAAEKTELAALVEADTKKKLRGRSKRRLDELRGIAEARVANSRVDDETWCKRTSEIIDDAVTAEPDSSPANGNWFAEPVFLECKRCESYLSSTDISRAPCGHCYCRHCLKRRFRIAGNIRCLPRCCGRSIPLEPNCDFLPARLVKVLRGQNVEGKIQE